MTIFPTGETNKSKNINKKDKQGRKQGLWIENKWFGYYTHESAYVDGIKQGHWVTRYSDGTVMQKE